MVKIKLTGDQIDEVVVFSLQQSLDCLLHIDNDGSGEYSDPNINLPAAIETVLKYYMVHTKAEEFLNNYAIRANLTDQHK